MRDNFRKWGPGGSGGPESPQWRLNVSQQLSQGPQRQEGGILIYNFYTLKKYFNRWNSFGLFTGPKKWVTWSYLNPEVVTAEEVASGFSHSVSAGRRLGTTGTWSRSSPWKVQAVTEPTCLTHTGQTLSNVQASCRNFISIENMHLGVKISHGTSQHSHAQVRPAISTAGEVQRVLENCGHWEATERIFVLKMIF